MLIARKPGLKYVNRVERLAYDFTDSMFTQDSAWHPLSLAAIIPANAKLVLLRVGASHASPGQCFRVSKLGQTSSVSVVNVVTQTPDVLNEQTALVECTGQQIQYWATSGTFSGLRLQVLGWFL